MSGVTGGATLLTKGLIEAVALGDVGIGSGVMADAAASAAVADHYGWRGPRVAMFAAIESPFGDH